MSTDPIPKRLIILNRRSFGGLLPVNFILMPNFKRFTYHYPFAGVFQLRIILDVLDHQPFVILIQLLVLILGFDTLRTTLISRYMGTVVEFLNPSSDFDDVLG